MALSTTSYGFGVHVPWPLAEAIERVTAALRDEGFGVLTTIDVQQTLQAKLGIESRPYVILGACNPQLAHRALAAEPEIGLLLPCNVVVYEADGATVVTAMDPAAALALSQNPALQPIAQDAKARLERVMHRLGEAKE